MTPLLGQGTKQGKTTEGGLTRLLHWIAHTSKFDYEPNFNESYHSFRESFQSRQVFLDNAYTILEFAGCIGLTDLMLPLKPLSSLSKLALRIICLLSSVPYLNLISRLDYEAQLREIGYTNIEIEDISPDVFSGLAGYIDQLDNDVVLKAAIDPGKLRQYRIFAHVLRWWSRGTLSYVIVKAIKGSTQKGPAQSNR